MCKTTKDIKYKNYKVYKDINIKTTRYIQTTKGTNYKRCIKSTKVYRKL